MRFVAPLFRALAAALKAAFGPAGVGPRELGLILGLALAAYGLDRIYPPAAAILPGAVLVYVAIVGLKS